MMYAMSRSFKHLRAMLKVSLPKIHGYGERYEIPGSGTVNFVMT